MAAETPVDTTPKAEDWLDLSNDGGVLKKVRLGIK